MALSTARWLYKYGIYWKNSLTIFSVIQIHYFFVDAIKLINSSAYKNIFIAYKFLFTFQNFLQFSLKVHN